MSTEQKHPTPTPAPAYGYPPQQMPQQPMAAAAPGQQVVYDAQGNAYIAMAAPGTPGAPGQQPMMHPPPMVIPGDRRNQALINEYQNTIRENEIGGVEICWFLCCGFFGLICCLPKYNASQEAKTKLQVELAKPA
ncbi:hypothetical protein BGW39_010712 [Mortierella sp. 14UC]|nr:hypothetical protein BGW39_010712 [Mortierella sp. 14UC]